MNSQELADEVARVVGDAQYRINGIGREQYSQGDHQKFEDKSPVDLLNDLREELIDIINYCVMLDIQVRKYITAAGRTVAANRPASDAGVRRFESCRPDQGSDDV